MADIKDFALEIHEKARLMHLISEDLISLARMEAGMMTYDLRMTEVGPLLEGVASEFREECRLRGLEVILQLQPSCPLPIDQEKLHQVLCNLLRNAMDATPKGGQISILTEEDLEECRIIIRDTGCGIEADEINQIFEKFTQIEDILHHQEGLGLGLALSERIIEDGHGGRIIAHSDGKGKGAEFVVHLSRDASAPES